MRAAGNTFAVGAEGHAGEKFSVPLEGEDLPSRLRVPHLHLVLWKAIDGGDTFAVGG